MAAQSSRLITLHDDWWPCFQLAVTALFSVGANSRVATASIDFLNGYNAGLLTWLADA